MKRPLNLLTWIADTAQPKLKMHVKKIDGVTNVSVSFIKQKMDLEAPDDKFDAIFAEAKNLIKKIEPDVTVKL